LTDTIHHVPIFIALIHIVGFFMSNTHMQGTY
jgi:hypothetical protein